MAGLSAFSCSDVNLFAAATEKDDLAPVETSIICKLFKVKSLHKNTVSTLSNGTL